MYYIRLSLEVTCIYGIDYVNSMRMMLYVALLYMHTHYILFNHVTQSISWLRNSIVRSPSLQWHV